MVHGGTGLRAAGHGGRLRRAHAPSPAGVGYTSLEIKVNYLRPIHGGIDLIAHGWVTKPGRRVAFAEGDIRDAEGRVLATASSTCLIMG